MGTPLPYKPLFFKVDSPLFRQFQRQALPASAGIGGKTTQRRIRRLGLNPESVGESPHLSGARGVGRH